MKIHYRHIAETFSILLSVFGAWAFYAQICVLTRTSFTALKTFSFLPILITTLLLFCFRHTQHFSEEEVPVCAKELNSAFLRYRIAAPLVIVLIYQLSGNVAIFWGSAILYLGIEAFIFSSEAAPKADFNPSHKESVGLLCICILSVLIAMGTLNPDDDDAILSIPVFAIDYPSQPMIGIDTLHKSGLPPIVETLHLVQVYELLIAVLSDIFGISVPVIYYLIFPAIWAILCVVSHWILLRQFLPEFPALFGTAIMLAILVFWGDGYRTFGNFGFVRLFQGKSAFLMVGLPAIVHSALQYRQNPDRRNRIFLLLHQSAAVGLSSTALVIAPLATALVFLARPKFIRSFKQGFSAIATIFPLVLAGAGMYICLFPYRMSLASDLSLPDYEYVLGFYRSPLILLALLLLPVLISIMSPRHSFWFSSYIWLSFLLLFSPISGLIMGRVVGNVFTWRIFWAFPFIFMLALFCGILVSKLFRRFQLGVFILWITVFAFSGSHAVDSYNWSWHNIGKIKVNQIPYETAQVIMTVAPKSGVALVPEPVAVYLCGFHGAPPMIGVRSLYLSKLKGLIPAKELNLRENLLDYVGSRNSKLSAAEFMRSIDRFNIRTIAFLNTHPDTRRLTEALLKQGFTVMQHNGYVVFLRKYEQH